MKNNTTYRWDMALPLMLVKLYPTGMLGIGLTAMMASFMSGMAGAQYRIQYRLDL
ncbi:MAG: hypothetical protein U0103_17965 [Candidatus Obscuribacterales bacterium]